MQQLRIVTVTGFVTARREQRDNSDYCARTRGGSSRQESTLF
uniref:Uncharacterized protein n=1 Tax=Arundo donax TaxID=35708 RepID=A0A0A8XYB6_ARUDO